MNRSTFESLSIAVVSIVACFWPTVAGAQSLSPGATVEALRTQFASQGYRVSAPTTWWTTDHLTTFTVADERDRAVMVFVYPDVATAQAARVEAQAREAVESPHLVDGYGPSTWRGNVALVQATRQELERQYAIQFGIDALAYNSANVITEPGIASPQQAVDAEFVAIASNSIADL